MFLTLTEIYFSKKHGTYVRGDLLIDISDVRKLSKVRDPSGEYSSRISFKGLPSSEDSFVRETPEVIRDLCRAYKEMLAVSKGSFSTNRQVQIEEPKPVTKKTAALPPTPKEFDDVFHTNTNNVLEYDDLVKIKKRG